MLSAYWKPVPCDTEILDMMNCDSRRQITVDKKHDITRNLFCSLSMWLNVGVDVVLAVRS